MKRFLIYLDTFSFKQILSFLTLFTFVLLIPFIWWNSSQKYTYKSKAALEPTVIPTPIIYGNLPQEQPVISGLRPYFAKVGDQVTLVGANFGHNPPQSELYLNSVKISEILSWADTAITFVVPPGAQSSVLALFIGSFSAKTPQPLIIYDKTTYTQLKYELGQLSLKNIQNVKQIVVWHDQKPEPESFAINELASSVEWLAPNKFTSLEGVVLYGGEDQIIPYWVDPLSYKD